MLLASSSLMFGRSNEADCILYTVADTALVGNSVAWHFAAYLIKARGHEHPRISGQRAAREVRRAGARGLCRDERRRGGRGGGQASRAAVGREGADPCRRPRQGAVQGAWRSGQGRRASRPLDRRG